MDKEKTQSSTESRLDSLITDINRVLSSKIKLERNQVEQLLPIAGFMAWSGLAAMTVGQSEELEVLKKMLLGRYSDDKSCKRVLAEKYVDGLLGESPIYPIPPPPGITYEFEEGGVRIRSAIDYNKTVWLPFQGRGGVIVVECGPGVAYYNQLVSLVNSKLGNLKIRNLKIIGLEGGQNADYIEAFLTHAARKLGVDFFTMNIQGMGKGSKGLIPIYEGKVSLIVMSLVGEAGIKEIKSGIENSYRLLDNQGRLVIFDSNLTFSPYGATYGSHVPVDTIINFAKRKFGEPEELLGDNVKLAIFKKADRS